MFYTAKISGQIPDPKNIMNTLNFEVSVESMSIETIATKVWELKEMMEKNREESYVIFIDGKNKTLPEEIMNNKQE